MQTHELGEQRVPRLDISRVDRDAGHRAQLHALRLVKVAHAVGAARRVTAWTTWEYSKNTTNDGYTQRVIGG
jgi:hypothetical protein